MIRFTAQAVTIDAAAGDEPTRQISGIAVPYGVDAVVSGGQRVRIEAGAIPTSGPAPRLLAEHDTSRVVGVVTARESTDAGMLFTAKIAATQAGDELLELIKMGAYDSVSVGLRPVDVEQDGRTTIVKAAEWEELSVVYAPAFSDAKILEIAASAEDEANPDEPETPQPSEEDTTMSDQTPEVVEAAAPVVPTAPIVFASPKKMTLPSLPDYIEAAREGGSRWILLNEQIKAATGDVVVSDAAGLVPTPVVTPYYDDIQPLRPIVSALGARSMPAAGSTFLRPKVVNHSGVDVQSSELATLDTEDFDLTNVTVTKKTFAGKLTLSEQVIDWSTPSMLEASVQDLAGQYALQTEKYVVDQMAAAITNTQEVIVTDFTDSAEVISDLYTAAADIAATGNYFPNALVMAPVMWAKLGALVDSSNRPLFPQTAPSNGIGLLPSGVTQATGNPLGLTLVVSNQIGTQAVGNQEANEYFWMLNTRGVEVYEDYKGFLQVVGTNLGVTVIVRGYFAAEVIDVNMIRILGPDATFS
jgi:hypothetical protein